MELIKNFVKDEEGVTLIEYGLIAALVAIAAIAALRTLGTSVRDQFTAVNTEIQGGTAGTGGA